MSKTVKYAERAVTIAAKGAWAVFEKVGSPGTELEFAL